MIPKRFEDIEFSDLEALLNNQVAEGKTIEYKREIVTNASSDKEPFLAGVSAFANTVGGDFIIGIEAKDGIPTCLPGANFANADAEILKLEQMLRNGLAPRLPSVNTKVIESPIGKKFIFIRVKQSWIAPHRVIANNKFYGRTSNGKYDYDVSELRTAFMLTEQLSERIKNFRQERVERIQTKDETPISLINGGKIILHLLPLTSFTAPTEFDVIELRKEAQFNSTSRHHNSEINLEGIVIFPNYETDATSYTQVFRNGCIEKVICLNMLGNLRPDDDFSSPFDEKQIIESLSDFLDFYSKLSIELPIYLFLTLINIKNYKFHIDDALRRQYEIRRKTMGDQKLVFNRNNLVFPEIIINDYSQPPTEILRSRFNLIWNSVGLTRDLNYDESGNWIEDLRGFYGS